MGLAFAIIYGGYALLCAVVFCVLIFLFKKRFWKTFSVGVVVVLMGGTYPSVISQMEGAEKARRTAALSYAPQSIDFENKRVVFVESSSSICGLDICGYALRHGNLAEAYSTALYPTDESFDGGDRWIFDIIEKEGVFHRVGLLNEEGLFFPEPLEKLYERPEVDYTVVVEDGFFIHAYEDAFGLSGQVPDAVRFSYMVFEGWPKTGQQPIARLLTVQFHTKPAFIWPVSNDFHYSPELFVHQEQVQGWFNSSDVEVETGSKSD